MTPWTRHWRPEISFTRVLKSVSTRPLNCTSQRLFSVHSCTPSGVLPFRADTIVEFQCQPHFCGHFSNLVHGSSGIVDVVLPTNYSISNICLFPLFRFIYLFSSEVFAGRWPCLLVLIRARYLSISMKDKEMITHRLKRGKRSSKMKNVKSELIDLEQN